MVLAALVPVTIAPAAKPPATVAKNLTLGGSALPLMTLAVALIPPPIAAPIPMFVSALETELDMLILGLCIFMLLPLTSINFFSVLSSIQKFTSFILKYKKPNIIINIIKYSILLGLKIIFINLCPILPR